MNVPPELHTPADQHNKPGLVIYEKRRMIVKNRGQSREMVAASVAEYSRDMDIGT